jgi:hypothetical protein
MDKDKIQKLVKPLMAFGLSFFKYKLKFVIIILKVDGRFKILLKNNYISYRVIERAKNLRIYLGFDFFTLRNITGVRFWSESILENFDINFHINEFVCYNTLLKGLDRIPASNIICPNISLDNLKLHPFTKKITIAYSNTITINNITSAIEASKNKKLTFVIIN